MKCWVMKGSSLQEVFSQQFLNSNTKHLVIGSNCKNSKILNAWLEKFKHCMPIRDTCYFFWKVSIKYILMYRIHECCIILKKHMF